MYKDHKKRKEKNKEWRNKEDRRVIYDACSSIEPGAKNATNRMETTLATEANEIIAVRPPQKEDEIVEAKITLLSSIPFVWNPCSLGTLALVTPVDHFPEPEDGTWDDYFFQVREYLRTRGDTVVPDHVELGMWCQVQRCQYRRKVLSQERTEALREIGFDFQGEEECRWYAMLGKMREYKEKNGDCLVPPLVLPGVKGIHGILDDENDGDESEARGVGFDAALSRWVSRQRMEKKIFDKVIKRSEEAMAKHNDLDPSDELCPAEMKLEADLRIDGSTNDDESDKIKHAEEATAKHNDQEPSGKLCPTDMELEADLRIQGSSNDDESGVTIEYDDSGKTPAKEGNDSVDKKVTSEEKDRDKEEEVVSYMTLEQVRSLDSLGFYWETDLHVSWIRNYRLLCAFRRQHGHCRITKNMVPYEFYHWVKMQRSHYTCGLQGRPGPLSPDKIHLLQSIDFMFDSDDKPGSYHYFRLDWSIMFVFFGIELHLS